MDTQRESNGWQTFLEHWWFLSIAVVAFLSSQLLLFFMRLTVRDGFGAAELLWPLPLLVWL
jgi:hypothetical protein